MFTINEIKKAIKSEEFNSDFMFVQQSLVAYRVQQELELYRSSYLRLNHFIECVLGSAPDWDSDETAEICRKAAEVSEFLSISNIFDDEKKKRFRLRTALLYEMAELPNLSGAILRAGDIPDFLFKSFLRMGPFGTLSVNGELKVLNQDSKDLKTSAFELALISDVVELAKYEQGLTEKPKEVVFSILSNVAKHLSLQMTATELMALATIVRKRLEVSTRNNIDVDLFDKLKQIQFPTELWQAQLKAINGGLLDRKFDSWGFAAPTGTGKTFLSRLLIISELQNNDKSKILYLVPSKALVNEVSVKLQMVLKDLNIKVVAVSPQLVELEDGEEGELYDADIVVLTPEKADMLLRLGVDFINKVTLVIVDEAHHIESGTRGILLEMYLWRLKKILKDRARIIFLSAVAPNINELASWIGKRSNSVISDQRSTRMRAGVYKIKGLGKNRSGWIEYSDGTKVCIVSSNVQKTIRGGIVQLVSHLSVAGPVLVVAKGKKECENLAEEMKQWLVENGNLKELTKEENSASEIKRLDSRLEREMYESVVMRQLIKNRIAYHHAGLPPRVRVAVEDAIRAKLVDYVFATTTLAEGVNFPFSTVIVQSLALREAPEKGHPSKYHPVTPRSFWNIAGRAGRPGFDKEGQAILFEPSLGLEKIKAVIGDYLNPSLNGVKPVRSALADSLNEIFHGLKTNEYSFKNLSNTVLPENLSKKTHGAINLLRVGIVHAKAAKIFESPEDILEGTFAFRHMDSGQKKLAGKLFRSQTKVINLFLKHKNSPPIEMIAELGVSIDTLSRLRDYVVSLKDWQIEDMANLFHGGVLDREKARYVVGPVASRMAELEGPTLGGFFSDIIIHWLSGIPLQSVKSNAELDNPENRRWQRLEDLISVIYTRIQYLLPWGLYAFDRLIEEEAKTRSINYENNVRSLAYIADAGVSSFDALRLVRMNLERVDATRLANLYHRKGGLSLDVDVVGWLSTQEKSTIVRCVMGSDNRGLDYDLFKIIDGLKIQK